MTIQYPNEKTCVVVGLGYIGLPTAAVIASAGVKVVGVDINEKIVRAVARGKCNSVEPGLAELVAEVVGSGQLKAQSGMPRGDVFIIAVPTPFEGGFKPDLSYVRAAARSIAPVLAKGNLVVVESTIPVGATEQVAGWLREWRPDLTFSERDATISHKPNVYVAHSPERILPGQMLTELVRNDRVIGGVCEGAAKVARDFYKRFVAGDVVATDARTAELCKLTENAFRDVNIAFANELAQVCEESQVDVWELIQHANRHPRVKILKPGPGVGGHCIAVDPWFLVSALSEKTRLMREARWINNERPRQVVRNVMANVGKLKPKTVACFGLSYKADVDDMRESPAVEIVATLAKELQLHAPGVKLLVTDPHITEDLPHELEDAHLDVVPLERALKADLLVMLVDHRPFLAVPREALKGKTIIDTRGVWNKGRASTWGTRSSTTATTDRKAPVAAAAKPTVAARGRAARGKRATTSVGRVAPVN